MAASFLTVRKNTIIIAEEIPEDNYGFRPTPESRSVAQLLMHIGLVPRIQEQVHAIEKRTTLVGFDFPTLFTSLLAEEQKSLPKAKIVEFLRTEGDRFAGWLATVSDDFLAQKVTMPPG